MTDAAAEVEEQEKDQAQPGVETFTTKASKEEGAREITMSWNIGKDVNESVEIFGAEVVHSQFKKAIIIAAQSLIRRMLEATNEDKSLKYTDEQIVNHIHNEYKPGIRSARGGSSDEKILAKALALLKKLPKEQRDAILAGTGE